MNPILQIENLTMKFGGLTAVDQLSFTIHEDEIVGLIGPNGAGKTTVFNCVTQFYKATSGTIHFQGKDEKMHLLNDYKPTDIIKLGLVRTFQNLELVPDLSILDNVLIGAHSRFKSGVLSNMLRFRKSRREELELKSLAVEILTFIGLAPIMYQYAYGQPYGVLKKIEIARTLMANPKLIILDEPAAGLNEAESMELASIIQEIKKKYKCSILLIEHDMSFVMNLCDKICAISFGKYVAYGTPKEIQNNKDVQVAYLGGE